MTVRIPKIEAARSCLPRDLAQHFHTPALQAGPPRIEFRLPDGESDVPGPKNRAAAIDTGGDLASRGLAGHCGLILRVNRKSDRTSVNERDELGDNLVHGLHHARAGRWVLRLALVLHGAKSGSPAERKAPRVEVQSDYAGRIAATAQRLTGDDVLRWRAVSSGV
jgi:hypothetical protein